ncbi:DUF4166 domain-containing protein [Denitrobaculum tricleocarpae]|uniref:DUF4166 domain-containing protein n=1 Tax=Denitrobaculum tricleocarpae TaxID=2591009 RepID=A0A545TB75_9PROT|nr:DUF4166 domain-containing protein [Denitrobaculum tricleocarpae]TQV74462.1 DUF4166 domain-containing protein [Denitrobaculum tricleocarpae]
MSLYRRVLGEKFETLPETLQVAHEFEGQRCLTGRVDVRCSETIIGKVLLRLLKLPRPGVDLTARILLQETGQGERWHREFGDDSFSSRVTPHRAKAGCIVETMGGVSAVVRLTAVPDGLQWNVESLSLLGLPLPHAIAPVTQAEERQIDGRYRFEVVITLPLLGLLISYRGWLQPDSLPAEQRIA